MQSTTTPHNIVTVTTPPTAWEQTLRELQLSWAATYLDSRPTTTTTTPVPVSPRPAGC